MKQPDNFTLLSWNRIYGATIFKDILFRLQPENKRKAVFVKTVDEALVIIEQRRAEYDPKKINAGRDE